MKKKILGIVVASAALLITGCQNAAPSNAGSSEPAPVTSSEAAVVRVTGVTLDRNNITLRPAQYTRLLATVAPENAANKELSWTSSNQAVARVDEKGTVTALKKGTATITVRTFDGSFTDTCTVVVESAHEIKVVNDAVVTFTAPAKAEDGELVKFNLNYDASKYVLDGVYANGVPCGVRNDGFYFYMPDSIATLEARYHAKPAAAVYKSVSIEGEGAFLQNVIGGLAEVGSKVEFTFSFIQGLIWDGTISVKAGGQDVSIVKVNGATYSFTMPNEDVVVTVGSKAEMIPFDVSPEWEDYFAYLTVDGEFWDKGAIPFGAEVEIGLYGYASNRYTYDEVLGLSLCNDDSFYAAELISYIFGVEYPVSYFSAEDVLPVSDEDWNVFKFKMPGYYTFIEPLAQTRMFEMEVQDTENVTLIPYEYDEDYEMYFELEDTEVYYSGDIYFKAEDIYGGSHDAHAVYVDAFQAYSTYYGSSSSTSVSKKRLDLNDEGYYKFTLNNWPRETLKVIIDEKDTTAYQQADLDGNYFGTYTWGTNKSADENPGNTYYINNFEASGAFVRDGEPTMVKSYDMNTGFGKFKEDDSSNELEFFAKEGVFFTNETKDLFSAVYKYSYFKMVEGDEKSAYKMSYECFNSGKALAMQVTRNGEPYKNLFVDQEAKIIEVNVDFRFIEGSALRDNNACYEVYKGRSKIATVSYAGNGGVANRGIVAPGAIFGTFKHDMNTMADLRFDGLGNAYFDNELIVLEKVADELDNAKYMFQDPTNGDYYTISVKVGLGLYTMISYKAFVAPVLAGKKFEGSAPCYTSSSSTYVYDGSYTIEFTDDTHVKVTTKQGSSNGITCTTTSKLANQTYSFVAGKLVIKFYASNSTSTLSTWSFFVNEAGTVLTGAPTNARVKGGSYYYIPETLNIVNVL